MKNKKKTYTPTRAIKFGLFESISYKNRKRKKRKRSNLRLFRKKNWNSEGNSKHPKLETNSSKMLHCPSEMSCFIFKLLQTPYIPSKFILEISLPNV